ncbi:MAG TPA: glucose-6-phosphate dehydrogenase [Polyangiaceae bacterium]|nr:glucose-6-phosphate dehydrogenase [Polyangiaceae bacterium]
MESSRSDAFIFFGATGDLAFKQIWPALQALVKAGRLDMPIVAIGRKDIGVEAIREKAKQSLEESKTFDGAAFEKLSKQVSYVAVDYGDPKTFDAIKKVISAAKHPLGYVALPPDVYEKVAANLAKAGLAKEGRLVLEKPFGHDAKSAKALSETLYASFPEEAIFRIDHYLGKEQVENIVYFRAANPLFEATWSGDYVACVEITMAESFGVKGRAEFYDGVGAVRDVVQNHLLEVVTCLAMELPAERGHSALREARTKLLARVKELRSEDLVRGQVRGYRDEKGVAKDSNTETFAALRLFIDTPRWKDVPFFIRTGKALAVTATDATVRWKGGHPVFEDDNAPPANTLRFRLGSDNVIALAANMKKPGESMVGEASELVLRRSSAGDMKPYERLLGDAIDGDATMYARRDTVEETWRVVDAALKANTPVHPYDEGSWGPEEAHRIAPEGGWTNPRK